MTPSTAPWQCCWHNLHQTPPLPWQRMHPTPTSAAPSNNRYRGPGNRWISFLASYSLQNRNTQRLTGNSGPPYDISGTSWRDAISSCGRTTDHWSQLGCPRNEKKKFRFEPKQTETRSVSRLFRETQKKIFSVCFSVLNLYRNNRNKQNWFETNRNND